MILLHASLEVETTVRRGIVKVEVILVGLHPGEEVEILPHSDPVRDLHWLGLGERMEKGIKSRLMVLVRGGVVPTDETDTVVGETLLNSIIAGLEEANVTNVAKVIIDVESVSKAPPLMYCKLLVKTVKPKL
jgi:hypothetical protein